MVSGPFPPLFPPALHKVTFLPADRRLFGVWQEGPNCERMAWERRYVLPPLVVTDEVFIELTNDRFGEVHVGVARATTVLPTEVWELAERGGALLPAIVEVRPRSPSALTPRQTGRVFLQTTAGIRRFDIAPVPARVGRWTVEIVTDAYSELRITHDLAAPPAGARLVRRWLLPLQVLDLPEPAGALKKAGTTVAALAGERMVTLDLRTGARLEALASGVGGAEIARSYLAAHDKLLRIGNRLAGGRTGRPHSITLRGGLVVAAHGASS